MLRRKFTDLPVLAARVVRLDLIKVMFESSIQEKSLRVLALAGICISLSAPAYLHEFPIRERIWVVLLWFSMIWIVTLSFASVFDFLVRKLRLSLSGAIFLYTFSLDSIFSPIIVFLTASQSDMPDLYVQALGIAFPVHFTAMAVITYWNLEKFERHFRKAGTSVYWWIQNRRIPDSLEDQLPFEKRGPILVVQASGHYVEVRTTIGNHIIRCTFREALKNLDPSAGHLVHRSYWVRKGEIVRVFYTNGNPKLETRDGQIIPVSRRAINRLKEDL